MTKRILAVIVVFAFTLNSALPAFSQTQQGLQFLEELKKVMSEKEEELSKQPAEEAEPEGQWQTFTCPSCGREFQINVSENTMLKKGLTMVSCPYDGTNFFPRQEAVREALREVPQYLTVTSPFEGKEFKAKIAPNDIISGKPIVDPYTRKTFRFKAEEVRPDQMSRGAWQTITAPDGTRMRVMVGVETKIRGAAGAAALYPEEMSSIERIFSWDVPQGISKVIKQFGYEYFPDPRAQVVPLQGAQTMPRMLRAQNMTGFSMPEQLTAELGLTQLMGSRSAASVFERGMSSPMGSIPVSSDYILGPDDTVIISLWGAIQQSFPVTIDAEGKVILPKVGPVYLWGLKFADAEELIRKKLLEQYVNINVGITMGKLRTIRVFVLGHVRYPGAYILSSQATVFHALYEAGGPTKVVSMRNIKLIRENKTEESVDLYKFLLEGDKSQDYRLFANDTILVMPIGDVFGIAGNVKQPAIYEIPSPIKLKTILDISGGINPVGYLQRIQIERVQEHQKKIVLDLEFKDAGDLKRSSEEIKLQDGDLVLIYPIGPLKRNYASILGNVQMPGDYQLKPGMTVKDIINKAGGLLPGTHMERADIMRIHGQENKKVIPVNLNSLFAGDPKENLELEEWDQITVYAKSEVSPARFVEIDGAVNNPGRYELTDDMLISDLIFVAGGLKQSASPESAELFRVATDQQPELLKIDLFNILNKKMGSADFALKEGDHLYVREKAEYAQEKSIKLFGELKYPGDYVIRKGERLSSVIRRAGGFTERAYLKGAVFTRKSVKELQRQMVRKFVESEQEAILQEEGSLAIGTSGPQSNARKELIEYRNKQIRTLENIGIFGRVVVNLDEPDKIAGTEDDILLEGDDTLYVPERPSVIQVVGNVRNQNTITYKARRGVDYYLAKAGGFTKNADKRGIFIIKANGEAVGTFAKIRYLDPGDTIIVPELFKYKTPPGILIKDAFQFTAQIATLALALAAVK